MAILDPDMQLSSEMAHLGPSFLKSLQRKGMKLAILLLLMIFPFQSVLAEAFTVNGINYETTSPTTVKVIKGDYSGDISIPSHVNGYTVTCIGEQAFFNSFSLASISLPNTITTIKHRAFYGCI